MTILLIHWYMISKLTTNDRSSTPHWTRLRHQTPRFRKYLIPVIWRNTVRIPSTPTATDMSDHIRNMQRNSQKVISKKAPRTELMSGSDYSNIADAWWLWAMASWKLEEELFVNPIVEGTILRGRRNTTKVTLNRGDLHPVVSVGLCQLESFHSLFHPAIRMSQRAYVSRRVSASTINMGGWKLIPTITESIH